MNPHIKQLFSDYCQTFPGPSNKVVAALLVLADVLSRSTSELIIVEPDDKNTVSVQEAAKMLNTNSKRIYQSCLAGTLRCVRFDGRIRIPLDEIKRFEAESTASVPRQ